MSMPIALGLGSLGTVILPPVEDVTPFTLRSGASYEYILSSIRVWIRDELVPYLQANNPQATFAEYAQIIVNAVNAAFAAQTPITDGEVLAMLNTPASQTLTWLYGHLSDGVTAPAPLGNGQDDTAALTAVIAVVHAIGSTVHLRAATYLCNLNLAPQFQQAKIIGKGMRATILKGFTSTAPVVQFNGGSGSIGGGGLSETGIQSAAGSNNGIALALSGTTGVKIERVQISGSFAEGVRFWNERPGDFTEMNTFEGDISGCYIPINYQVDNGVESFHGSGVVGNTSINVPADSTSPVVNLDKNALPYNAPMSINTWMQPNSYLFHVGSQGRSPGRHPSFHGSIRVENHASAANSPAAINDDGQTTVLLVGGIIWLGCDNMVLGALKLCKKVMYAGGSIVFEPEPMSSFATLKNSPTIIAAGDFFEAGSITLAAVHVTAPNYEYHAVLAVQHDAFNGDTGHIAPVVQTQGLDSNNVGAPTFYIGGGGALYAANPNFSNAFSAYVTATPLHGSAQHNLLPQAHNA